MSTEELKEAHGGTWGEHIDYPVADWILDASNGDTRLGYWEWVENMIEAQEDAHYEEDRFGLGLRRKIADFDDA